VPVALTEKVASLPEQMITLLGEEVIAGAVLMVSEAADEVAFGVQVPLTTQRYCPPVVAPVIVRLDEVAPEILFQLLPS
jgi:hypothetical protein